MHDALRRRALHLDPANGWRFLEVLTSPEFYAQAYCYRILVEPAAVLDSAFVPDRPALLAIRTRHEQMLNGNMTALSPASLFDLAANTPAGSYSTVTELQQRLSWSPLGYHPPLLLANSALDVPPSTARSTEPASNGPHSLLVRKAF